jgi:hypothetical protein
MTNRKQYSLLRDSPLVAVGWLWDRSKGSADPVTVIGKTFDYAAGAIALLWLGLMIIGGILQG